MKLNIGLPPSFYYRCVSFVPLNIYPSPETDGKTEARAARCRCHNSAWNVYLQLYGERQSVHARMHACMPVRLHLVKQNNRRQAGWMKRLSALRKHARGRAEQRIHARRANRSLWKHFVMHLLSINNKTTALCLARNRHIISMTAPPGLLYWERPQLSSKCFLGKVSRWSRRQMVGFVNIAELLYLTMRHLNSVCLT